MTWGRAVEWVLALDPIIGIAGALVALAALLRRVSPAGRRRRLAEWSKQTADGEQGERRQTLLRVHRWATGHMLARERVPTGRVLGAGWPMVFAVPLLLAGRYGSEVYGPAWGAVLLIAGLIAAWWAGRQALRLAVDRAVTFVDYMQGRQPGRRLPRRVEEKWAAAALVAGAASGFGLTRLAAAFAPGQSASSVNLVLALVGLGAGVAALHYLNRGVRQLERDLGGPEAFSPWAGPATSSRRRRRSGPESARPTPGTTPRSFRA